MYILGEKDLSHCGHLQTRDVCCDLSFDKILLLVFFLKSREMQRLGYLTSVGFSFDQHLAAAKDLASLPGEFQCLSFMFFLCTYSNVGCLLYRGA